MAELTCQELVELVTDYFDDALPESERMRFDAHLEECEGCRLYLEQMRTTIRLTGSSQELADRQDVNALLQAFRDFRRA
jgi:anti-sigma factor RsiW